MHAPMQKIRISQGRHGTHQSVHSNLSKYIWRVRFKSLALTTQKNKSDKLQHNALGPWTDCLIDQASDGPSIILID